MISSIVLDDVDRLLIRHLQKDVRASYQDLAKEVGASASTVRRRIERLVEGRVIKLVAVPAWDRNELNLTAFIAISVDLYRLRAIGARLAEMHETVFVAMVTGDHDLIAEVVLPMNADFVRFVTQRIAPIEGIRDIQTFMVPEFIKSFEEFRLPAGPDPLYMRGANGRYLYHEDELVQRDGKETELSTDG